MKLKQPLRRAMRKKRANKPLPLLQSNHQGAGLGNQLGVLFWAIAAELMREMRVALGNAVFHPVDVIDTAQLGP